MEIAKAFVVGTGRCGTTLMAQMLNSHSRICVPHELQILFETNGNGPRLYELLSSGTANLTAEDCIKLIENRCPYRFEEYFDYGDFFRMHASPLPPFRQVVNQLYDAIARSKGKEIFIEQTPWYGQRIDILHAAFPQAKYIHMVRDGRDVALSFSKTPWWHDDVGLNLERWHSEVKRIFELAEQHLPAEQILQVRYEDLVEDPEAELHRVCEHLGVEFEPEMLDPHGYIDYRRYSKLGTSSPASASLKEWREARSSPTFKGSMYGWKKSADFDFSAVPNHVHDLLESLGYENCHSLQPDILAMHIEKMGLENAFQKAAAWHKSGKLEKAEEYYRAILQVQPDHSMANHNLGIMLMERGIYTEALPCLLAALEADPSRGQFWLSYIEALARDGQRETAQAILDMARQQGLEGPEVEALLATLAAQADPEVGYCPVCGDRQARFLPLPDSYREQARLHGFERFGQGEMISLDKYTCQRCGASDRERIYALWLDSQLAQGKLQPVAKVLHFAPEAALSNKLRQQFTDYTTADFSMAQVDYKVDLQALPFADESYDLFLCSHVLEHVPSDDLAIRELYRITRKGGGGILVAPISLGLERTVEDPGVTDEAGRWRLFGQNDHVRLYAHDDYVERIRSAGFRVEQLGQDDFGEDVFRQLGMKPTSILYIVYR